MPPGGWGLLAWPSPFFLMESCPFATAHKLSDIQTLAFHLHSRRLRTRRSVHSTQLIGQHCLRPYHPLDIGVFGNHSSAGVKQCPHP